MKAASAEVIPAAPGTPFAGGIFAGRFFVGADAYALVVAPKAQGECHHAIWNESRAMVDGALSAYDGPANTAAMAAAGSGIAQWAQELRLGDFDDWYLPSRGEALLAFAAAIAGDDAFSTDDYYWTSTQYAGHAEYAWFQFFGYGYQNTWHKSFKYRARAVRRVKIT